MMMDSKDSIADQAINNRGLYVEVLEHRRKFIGLKGFNYDELYPSTLCIIPSDEIVQLWEEDYEFMCQHMIYGTAPSFKELLKKLTILNEKIRQLDYYK